MSSSNPVMEFLSTNWGRFPYLIVYIVGLVLALVFWRRNARASLLSLIAFILFLLSSILDVVFTWFVVRSGFNSEFESRGMVLGVGHFLLTLLGITAWVLILIALFCRRSQEPTWAPDEPERYGRRYPASDRPSGSPGEDIQR